MMITQVCVYGTLTEERTLITTSPAETRAMHFCTLGTPPGLVKPAEV